MSTLLFLSSILFLCTQVSSYCWQVGMNPGFDGTPSVEQMSLTRVRVLWTDIIRNRECTDNFVVKYWPSTSPQAYDVTDLISKKDNSVEVEVTPKVEYTFQVVAREDKGLIGGVDWNKSPEINFRTSSSVEVKQNIEPVEEGNRVFSLIRDEPRLMDPAKMKIMGIATELFIMIIVGCVILLVIIVGVIYRVATNGKRKQIKHQIQEEIEEDETQELTPEKHPV